MEAMKRRTGAEGKTDEKQVMEEEKKPERVFKSIIIIQTSLCQLFLSL